MAQKLKLVPDSVSFHGGEQANQWIGVGTVVLGAFLVYGALSLLWKWWNAAELKVFFARGEFPIFSLPFGVFCFVLSLACECALLLAGGWARRAPPNLFPTLAAVVIAAGLSIAWRFIRTLTKEDWTSAFHEHGAVWAGRAAVATVVVLPGIIWDDRVYGNVLPPDSGVFTGPVSGFCLLVWLLAALLCGPASRMRAGVWLRRRVEAWSQAGSKQDVLERHAAQLVADGAAVQDILERLKNDPSLKGDPKLIRVERNIRMVLRRLAGRAMRVARQLDPAARQEQIDDVSRFRDAVMPVRRPAHSARP
jgi:hypothetical protein